jgi:hypothetical protein
LLTIAWLGVLVATPAAARRTVSIDGDVAVVQIDDFDGGGSRLVHELRSRRTGRVVELVLEDGTPRLRTGMRVRARGTLATSAGTRRPVLTVGRDRDALTVLSEPVAEAAVVGTRSAIVLVVDFAQDGKTVACTDAAIGGMMFTGDPSVDRLYQQASFGQLSWPRDTDGNGVVDVFRVTIDDAGNDCDTPAWRAKADAAAAVLGASLGLYQHRLYVLPSTVACGWAGYAVIGCSASCWAMVATCDRGDVYAHELGHNLGMYHASFDANDDGAVDATCPWGVWPGGGEYCDDSDFMGISTNVWRQTNAPHKLQMGWVPANRVVDVVTSGTYAIAPLETDPAATALPLVLRIAKPDGSYLVSYRRRVGYDAGMRIDYADRTNVHSHGGGNTLLNALLADGQGFGGAGIGLAQMTHDASAVQIAVTLQCGNGVIDPGEECDGANLGGATCGGCAGTPTCTGCRLNHASCTDGTCETSETCAGCPQDCVGGARCGNGVCEVGDGESCVSCPADCPGVQSGSPAGRFCCGAAGTNPVGCDPGRCGAACTTQTVTVCCGDAVCNGDETSSTCARDCGTGPTTSTTSSTSTSSTTSSTTTSSSSTSSSSTSTTTTRPTTSTSTTNTSTSSTSSTTGSATSSTTTAAPTSTASSTSSTTTTAAPTSSTSSTTTTSTTTSTSSLPTGSTAIPATTSTTSTTAPGPVYGAQCPTTPLAGCRASASQRSLLVVRTPRGTAGLVRWKLAQGGMVEPGELASAALASAGLRLCVYDASVTGQPMLAVRTMTGEECGAVACWRARGGSAWGTVGYRNRTGLPGGITDVRLHARRGELAALVRARGAAVTMPAGTPVFPLMVQLVAGETTPARCWQAVFATALRHDATTVKAVQP